MSNDVKDVLERIKTHGIAYFSREQEDIIIAALKAYQSESDDTRRLDWLSGPDRHVTRRRSDTCTEKAVSFFINGYRRFAEGNNLREAIDRAMRAYEDGIPPQKD